MTETKCNTCEQPLKRIAQFEKGVEVLFVQPCEVCNEALKAERDRLREALLNYPNVFAIDHGSHCDFGWHDKVCTCGMKGRHDRYVSSALNHKGG